MAKKQIKRIEITTGGDLLAALREIDTDQRKLNIDEMYVLAKGQEMTTLEVMEETLSDGSKVYDLELK